MPYFLVTGDITTFKTDAIVNAANNTLLGGGGVDGAIHRAAGRGLLDECKTLGGCETGDAKITRGYNLPAKYVIHTVGPIWYGGTNGERALLYSCYKRSLAIAKEMGLESIAFPLISSGVYGYPKREALSVAEEAIREFLRDNDMTVYMVIYDRTSYEPPRSGITAAIASFIRNAHALEGSLGAPKAAASKPLMQLFDGERKKALRREAGAAADMAYAQAVPETCRAPQDLTEMIESLDMSFSELLLELIDERGMTDVECYKAANIDRRLFSKIRTDKNYHPTKITCIALGIALHLNMSELQALLRAAGYTLSRSSRFDVIIEYFVTNGVYDVITINDTLFEYDETLLGNA